MDSRNLPVLHSARDLSIDYPDVNPHIPEMQALKTREKITQNGAYTDDGRAYVEKRAILQILATDAKGANRFYNGLENEDKLERGKNRYASVASLNKELSERVQEPRDTIVRERLRDAENCLNAMRDAPELEKLREVEESKNRKEQPLLKRKKIRAEGIRACQLTGEDLDPSAAAHHIERRADKPRRSRDMDNIVVVNPPPHDDIHRSGAESGEELKALCEKRGWKRQ